MDWHTSSVSLLTHCSVFLSLECRLQLINVKLNNDSALELGCVCVHLCVCLYIDGYVGVSVCLCLCEQVCANVSVRLRLVPHLPDRGRAGGCVPAGCRWARASLLPAPPPHTEKTGPQTGSAPGSYNTTQTAISTVLHYGSHLSKNENKIKSVVFSV